MWKTFDATLLLVKKFTLEKRYLFNRLVVWVKTNQNFHLLLNALGISISSSTFLSNVLCEPFNEKCYLKLCPDCPKPEKIQQVNEVELVAVSMVEAVDPEGMEQGWTFNASEVEDFNVEGLWSSSLLLPLEANFLNRNSRVLFLADVRFGLVKDAEVVVFLVPDPKELKQGWTFNASEDEGSWLSLNGRNQYCCFSTSK